MNKIMLFKNSYHLAFIILLAIMVFAACDRNTTKEVFVSPLGIENATGTLEDPFASIDQAVAAVRIMRKKGSTEPVTIYLREGRHPITETIVLGTEDGSPSTKVEAPLEDYGSGTLAPAYLTFAAYQDEQPVVSGGIAVEGWKLQEATITAIPDIAKGKVWVADLPDGLDKFYTLYDHKGRLKRARAAGFVPTEKGDKTTLHFPKGKLQNWDNLSDVEINIRPSRAWMINMLPIESVDEENGIAKTKVSATYDMGQLAKWVHTQDGNSAWVENTLEALDEPGEWVINTTSRKIYLWPSHPASDGSPQGILAPSTTELILVGGNSDYNGPKDDPVKGIAFSGITFKHADRRGWEDEEDRRGWGMQHDWDLFDRPTALLRFRGAEDCHVSNCKFEDSGGSGIRLDLHAQHNRIEDSEFAHLGEAGIILAGYGTGTKDVNHHNDIINNHIHHFSEITWHSPGIWAWQSGYNKIAHNYIHHSGYSAVLITNRVEPDRTLNGEGGRTVRRNEIPTKIIENTAETYTNWKEREKYNHARHNYVEYNEITHSVQLLSDGNAIYISGAGTGNVIRYNYIHDNGEHSMPSAIRCDDDQHETLIHGNVLANNFCFAAGIVSKGVNDITNNFIVSSVTPPRYGYISYEWVSVKNSSAKKNIIISHPEGGNAHGERPRMKGEPYDGVPLLVETKMDSNLYYHPMDKDWMVDHFLKMRAVGNEVSSVFADPMFVDAKNGNFKFRENSPALNLGIEVLDVSKMGLQNNRMK